MHELTRRLAAHPARTAELCLATFLLNLLALADTIYVMILLRRYIQHGFDGTLLLLTAGALVAVAMQWGLTRARGVLAANLGAGEDERLADAVHAALAGATLPALQEVGRERASQAASDLADVQAGCDGGAVTALLDAPFSLMFAASVYFLSPLLAGITALGIAASLAVGWAGAGKSRESARALTEAVGEGRAILYSSGFAADTVRVWRGAPFYRALFRAAQARVAALRGVLEDARGLALSLGMGVGVVVRVALYAVGAKLVVEGRLSVAALIGVSIMGSYAMAKASGAVQVGRLMARSREALERLGALTALPREAGAGLRPEGWDGALELRGLGFSFGGQPLFSGLDLRLPRGGVLAVRGHNGSGKTTLVRLLAGLVPPGEGAVLAGDASLADIDPAWWRARLCYLPQEPFFLAGTVRENILMGLDGAGPDNSADAAPGDPPGAAQDVVREVVRAARLTQFLDTSAHGVETQLADAGRTLPVGIRKRLALARALARLHTGQARLALLDEPTAGMDEEGAQAVYEAMNAMARAGLAIVAVTSDQNILRGARAVLDLGVKPVPTVTPAARGGEGAP